MTKLSDLETPAFVINRHAFVRNCCRVRDEAVRRKIVRLRPHVKTHKTKEGAFIQAFCRPPPPDPQKVDQQAVDETGSIVTVTGFVASTLPEIFMLMEASVKYGKKEPFQDVLYGVPVSESKLIRIDKLRSDWAGSSVHLLVDHPTQVDMVEKFVSDGRNQSSAPFSVYLKLDTGYHRAGISCDEKGVLLAAQIFSSEVLHFKGIYSHCGHAYDTNDQLKLDEIAQADLSMMRGFLDKLKQFGDIGKQRVDLLDVSVGSTPSLFHHSSSLQLLERLELHPGNYTMYDRQQLWSGAASTESSLAGRVLARVIGHYEDRNTIMLDAGALAMTKDSTPQGGACAVAGHPGLFCYRMSQEVTLCRPADPSQKLPLSEFPLGTLLSLLPNHSCLAAACFDKFYVIDDPLGNYAPEEEIVEEWLPAKGW
jgi:D-serine deaminase-like pyridoxal phosphate-dependent protein